MSFLGFFGVSDALRAGGLMGGGRSSSGNDYAGSSTGRFRLEALDPPLEKRSAPQGFWSNTVGRLGRCLEGIVKGFAHGAKAGYARGSNLLSLPFAFIGGAVGAVWGGIKGLVGGAKGVDEAIDNINTAMNPFRDNQAIDRLEDKLALVMKQAGIDLNSKAGQEAFEKIAYTARQEATRRMEDEGYVKTDGKIDLLYRNVKSGKINAQDIIVMAVQHNAGSLDTAQASLILNMLPQSQTIYNLLENKIKSVLESEKLNLSDEYDKDIYKDIYLKALSEARYIAKKQIEANEWILPVDEKSRQEHLAYKVHELARSVLKGHSVTINAEPPPGMVKVVTEIKIGERMLLTKTEYQKKEEAKADPLLTPITPIKNPNSSTTASVAASLLQQSSAPPPPLNSPPLSVSPPTVLSTQSDVLPSLPKVDQHRFLPPLTAIKPAQESGHVVVWAGDSKSDDFLKCEFFVKDYAAFNRYANNLDPDLARTKLKSSSDFVHHTKLTFDTPQAGAEFLEKVLQGQKENMTQAPKVLSEKGSFVDRIKAFINKLFPSKDEGLKATATSDAAQARSRGNGNGEGVIRSPTSTRRSATVHPVEATLLKEQVGGVKARRR